MQVRRFGFADRDTVAFDPGVRCKLLPILTNADAELRRYSLPSQQPPQRKRPLETSGRNGRVSGRSEYHARRQCNMRFHGPGWRAVFPWRDEFLQEVLRGAEAAQPQTYGKHREQEHGPQEKCFCGARERAKPPKSCPHRQVAWRSNRFRQDESEGRAGWIATCLDPRQIHR